MHLLGNPPGPPKLLQYLGKSVDTDLPPTRKEVEKAGAIYRIRMNACVGCGEHEDHGQAAGIKLVFDVAHDFGARRRNGRYDIISDAVGVVQINFTFEKGQE